MKYLYQDPKASEDARVSDLLSRMTLEEKFSQLRLNGNIIAFAADKTVNEENFEDRFAEIYDPDRTSCAYLCFDADPRLVNRMQEYTLARSRLGIPMLFMGESVHGAMMTGATLFPQAIGLGATFDPELIGQIAAVAGRDCRSYGVRMTYAPDLDISQDPRWGRVEENYGEDPYLTSRLAVSYVKNLQQAGVAACPKHYLAHGTPEGGINLAPVHIGEREIREHMLPAFEAAVREGGAWGIMPAYSELDGIPLHANHHWLTEVLRGELGFDGMIVSDFGAIEMLYDTHRIAKLPEDAGEMALRAGVDVEAPDPIGFRPELTEKFRTGQLPMTLVDTAVSRVLRIKFRLGLFENPYLEEGKLQAMRGEADLQVAYQAALESAVLLKNQEDLLPLSPKQKIALVGPNAALSQVGDYSAPANMQNAVSLLESLSAQVPALSYEQGCGLVGKDESFAKAVEAVGMRMWPSWLWATPAMPTAASVGAMATPWLPAARALTATTCVCRPASGNCWRPAPPPVRRWWWCSTPAVPMH